MAGPAVPPCRQVPSLMLPLGLLNVASKKPIMVELKSGETFNGILNNCDFWMNCNLKEVVCTSADGNRFWKLPECHIRGINIKYIRIPDELLDVARDENEKRRRTQGGKMRSNKPGGDRRTDRGGYKNYK